MCPAEGLGGRRPAISPLTPAQGCSSVVRVKIARSFLLTSRSWRPRHGHCSSTRRPSMRRRCGPCARRGRDCGWRSARPCPDARTSSSSSSNTCSAVCGSRLPVGSSARSSRGALARARAIATRCCSPPESSRRAVVAAARRGRASRAARSARASRLARSQAGDQLRHHDVLERRELRQQMMELVDEADLDRGACGCARRRRAAAIAAVDEHLAGVGPLEQAGDVQQRRLAGARRRRPARRSRPARATRSAPLQHVERRAPWA